MWTGRGFSVSNEVMVDRLAAITGRHPLVMRAEMLEANPRASTVIKKLQSLANANPVPLTMARGFAFAYEGTGKGNYQYYSGHMADVSKADDGSWKVHRTWIVADHGRVINPSGFRRQIYGSLVFALSMLRSGAITVEHGAVVEGNFDAYPISMIAETPRYVEIELVDSDEWPMGVGEKMQSGIQPAIINAFEKLSGQEVSALPITGLL
jgi:isoquinoline 1-oxidoreductase beta subunit